MAALDTNALVRFLVEDDPPQLLAVKSLMLRAIEASEPLFVPVTVLLELEWVLRSNYKFSKAQIVVTFINLLSAPEIFIESEFAVEHALQLFEPANADFADCVHTALAVAAGEQPLWTFDQRAAQLEGARLIGDR